MKLFKKSRNVVTPPEPVTGTAGSLREFVYLDEISVYSLTSAPDMPPPVTMSESADSTTGEVMSGHIEGGAPIVAKANVSGELNSSRTRGLQIQRQFNIQSQFARLHGLYRPTFLMAAEGGELKSGKTSNLSDALRQLEVQHRAVRATDLTRGALTETRVSLRAHHTFDVTVFIRIMGGLFKKYPEFAEIDPSMLQTVMDGGELLAELMEDLVPIEGRSTTHAIVTDTDGELWVAEVDAIGAIYDGDLTTDPLLVVGVAETNSFWKDTRRILHAEAEFDVLGRVSRTGLQDEWTPVKMVDTFKRIIPSVATGLIEAVENLKNFDEGSPLTADPVVELVLAGTKLYDDLARHHQVSTSGLLPETLAAMVLESETLEGKLAALNKVADAFYAHHADLDRDEDTVGRLRQSAWRKAQEVVNLPEEKAESKQAPPATPVLELEFIAMYW